MPASPQRPAVARLVAVACAGALAVALAVAPALAAPPRGVSLVGFSFTSSIGSAIDPGGTLTSRNCKPKRLIAFAAFSRIRSGTLVTYTWRKDGKLVTSWSQEWSGGTARTVRRIVLSNSEGIPRGVYQLAIKVPGTKTATGKITLAC